MTQRGDLARGPIGGLLNHVAVVTFRPVPFDLMTGRGFVQTLPPLVICLAAVTAFHRLNYVTRVGVQTHAARLLQCFEAERCRGDLSLLIGGFTQIDSESPPQPLIAQQRHRRRAGYFATVAEARAVTENRNSFHEVASLRSTGHRLKVL